MKLLLGFAIAPSSSALGVRRLAFGAWRSALKRKRERVGGMESGRERESKMSEPRANAARQQRVHYLYYDNFN